MTARKARATTRTVDESDGWGGFLFEAGAAEDWAALAWLERNGGGLAALGAGGAGFGASTRGSDGPPGLAGFAVLGVIGELLGVKEALFVGGKDEVASADYALQGSI
jgi:hypothetical protein